MSDLTGKTINQHYFLRSLVGSGATADVYLAWDVIRTTQMALKILRQDLTRNEQIFKLFGREADLLRKLEHPGIVRLYEYNRDGDLTYLVMDWIDGSNLHQFIQSKKKPLAFTDISNVLASVCPALNYAHHNHIYHCDVKPANILLSNDKRVMLTDFGVAHFANQTGLGGTPPYMAPEQFAGDPIDARTDVYALGITLYEMLTGGDIPYKGTSQVSSATTLRDRIAWEHLNMDIPSLRERVPNLSRSVETVVCKALAKNPRDRFQTTIELQEAFERSLTETVKADSPRPTVLFSSAPPPIPQRNQNVFQKFFSSPVKGPSLIVRQGDFLGSVIPIPAGGFTIGRSKTCQLQLTEPSISRIHATIIVAQNGVFIRDENSSLGTAVNGTTINAPMQLYPGDIIYIGYSQIFEYQA